MATRRAAEAICQTSDGQLDRSAPTVCPFSSLPLVLPLAHNRPPPATVRSIAKKANTSDCRCDRRRVSGSIDAQTLTLSIYRRDFVPSLKCIDVFHIRPRNNASPTWRLRDAMRSASARAPNGWKPAVGRRRHFTEYHHYHHYYHDHHDQPLPLPLPPPLTATRA